MKLVIDIPEKIYKELTETAIMVTEVYPSTIERALTEGTPYEEQKTGKWNGHRCSECKKICTDNIRGTYEILHKPKYCPHCGVKMEADE